MSVEHDPVIAQDNDERMLDELVQELFLTLLTRELAQQKAVIETINDNVSYQAGESLKSLKREIKLSISTLSNAQQQYQEEQAIAREEYEKRLEQQTQTFASDAEKNHQQSQQQMAALRQGEQQLAAQLTDLQQQHATLHQRSGQMLNSIKWLVVGLGGVNLLLFAAVIMMFFLGHR
ncbi:hypothetical protein [Pantoea cypripedii]|uniref:Uncharacterized protein n=1 Tax=Pantoea cypripedii TaxID=55209 RepID=A0A1X1ETK1_PANCY|nr:hypothetical protein [Pantoea cypripedii]MBP2197434.1 rubrerythrin [Pantoea cypripedii]ORM93338.1 hypothetical protein HA50_08250 [Pantoea cypripedii]